MVQSRKILGSFIVLIAFKVIEIETQDTICRRESQNRVDLENDVILNQISNYRDVSAKWISGTAHNC